MSFNDKTFRANHNIGYDIVNKVAQFTTQQTGVAIWTPAAGNRIVVTALQIQAFAVTGGTATLWYGASGDTTYTRGTDFSVFDGEFAPSTTNKPGVMVSNLHMMSPTADFILRFTSSAALSITINVWGYEAAK